jgi:hypothetical protein
MFNSLYVVALIGGANHRFMPIVLESIPGLDFIKWVVAEA